MIAETEIADNGARLDDMAERAHAQRRQKRDGSKQDGAAKRRLGQGQRCKWTNNAKTTTIHTLAGSAETANDCNEKAKAI